MLSCELLTSLGRARSVLGVFCFRGCVMYLFSWSSFLLFKGGVFDVWVSSEDVYALLIYM